MWGVQAFLTRDFSKSISDAQTGPDSPTVAWPLPYCEAALQYMLSSLLFSQSASGDRFTVDMLQAGTARLVCCLCSEPLGQDMLQDVVPDGWELRK